MNPSKLDKRHVTVQDALSKLPGPNGEHFVAVLAHGSLLVEIAALRGEDKQKPHTRDEIYVVINGSGMFRNGVARHPFGPGDVLFVPAGVEHRFEDFSDDLTVWVFFYGPEGGEVSRI